VFANALLVFLPRMAWLISGQNSWDINVTESYQTSSLQLRKPLLTVRSLVG
jgi:hypothetical protein